MDVKQKLKTRAREEREKESHTGTIDKKVPCFRCLQELIHSSHCNSIAVVIVAVVAAAAELTAATDVVVIQGCTK